MEMKVIYGELLIDKIRKSLICGVHPETVSTVHAYDDEDATDVDPDSDIRVSRLDRFVDASFKPRDRAAGVGSDTTRADTASASTSADPAPAASAPAAE